MPVLTRVLAAVSAVFALSAPLLSLAAGAPGSAKVAPYTLDNTEVHTIPSSKTGREYKIFVSLPDSYTNGKQHYPVLYVTDANYAFPVARSLARRVSDHGKALQDFILVGLSYASGDDPQISRRRDYTPTDIIAKKSADAEDMREHVVGDFGQADVYRDYLERQVMPFVRQHYRVEGQKKIYYGHSYGGLFGGYVLFSKPELFDYYILSSPSFWYDKRYMFTLEKEYAQKHRDLRAQVALYIAAFEARKPGDERYNQETDMVEDTLRMGRQLQARRYPGLKVQTKVIPDEDHLSVGPLTITRGLKWALGKK